MGLRPIVDICPYMALWMQHGLYGGRRGKTHTWTQAQRDEEASADKQ